MWVEATKNGKYKACERYTDPLTGKFKKVSVTIEKDNQRTRKAAQEELADKIRQAMEKSPNADITLGKLRDAYLADKKLSVRASTYGNFVSDTKNLLKIIPADTKLSELTATYITSQIRKETVKTTKINHRIKTCKMLFRWGYENDYLQDRSLMDKLKPVKDDRKARIEDKYLEPKELSALLKTMPNTQWMLLTKFLALTGMRIGEAIALTMDDIDSEYIHVTKTYMVCVCKLGDAPKTAESIRDVYIQPELKSCISEIKSFRLQEMLKHNYKTDLLFSRHDGSYINYNAYKTYLAKAADFTGKHITPHALRHTHVSILAAQGVPFDVIARRLGHRGDAITKAIYFHVTENLREKDNKKMKAIRFL